MCNISQNNGIKSINKEVTLLEDRLQINKKSVSQFQNALTWVRRLWLKQGQKTNLSKSKKMQEALRNIFGSKIKHFKKKMMYLKMHLKIHKKERNYSKKA